MKISDNKTITACAVVAVIMGGLLMQSAMAEVTLPKIFSRNMVIQQGMPVNVWGLAKPKEMIEVSFKGNKASAKADASGKWQLELPAQSTSSVPAELIVQGTNRIVLDNVLVGEVWLCSGQSNMQMGVGKSDNGQTEIAAAKYPNIRLFTVLPDFSPAPLGEFVAANGWNVCTPDNLAQAKKGGFAAAANGFSAVGYFFGRELQKELNVPIGLIEADLGSTKIDAWISPEGYAMVPLLAEHYRKLIVPAFRSQEHRKAIDVLLQYLVQWQIAAGEAVIDNAPIPPLPVLPDEFIRPEWRWDRLTLIPPCWLHNAMLHPMIPFQVRGTIWYQGESNRNDGENYFEKSRALISGWRKLWDNPKLPYYIVQIAPYNYNDDQQKTLPIFWENQYAVSRKIPHSGIVGTTDLADLKDIHPSHKQKIGQRLARLVLQKTYGYKIIAESPVLKFFAVEKNKVIIHFDNVPTGLKSKDGKPLNWFEVADLNTRKFVNAQAVIDGKTVIISAPGVDFPEEVRFGWSEIAEPNLISSEGLPVYPFRTGKISHAKLTDKKQGKYLSF